jgi:hypothetical protein
VGLAESGCRKHSTQRRPRGASTSRNCNNEAERELPFFGTDTRHQADVSNYAVSVDMVTGNRRLCSSTMTRMGSTRRRGKCHRRQTSNTFSGLHGTDSTLVTVVAAQFLLEMEQVPALERSTRSKTESHQSCSKCPQRRGSQCWSSRYTSPTSQRAAGATGCFVFGNKVKDASCANQRP